MTWIVRLTDQDCAYGPFTDAALADQFAAFLTAEIDPAEVLPAASTAAGLLDPVRELLAWRDMVLDPTNQVPPACPEKTAFAAIRHANRDTAMVGLAVSAWLRDPDENAMVPAESDRMLAHIADTAEAARALLAREAADLDKIRTIGETPQ